MDATNLRPTSFRFDPKFLAELKELTDLLSSGDAGRLTRTQVIRVAVRRQLDFEKARRKNFSKSD